MSPSYLSDGVRGVGSHWMPAQAGSIPVKDPGRRRWPPGSSPGRTPIGSERGASAGARLEDLQIPGRAGFESPSLRLPAA